MGTTDMQRTGCAGWGALTGLQTSIALGELHSQAELQCQLGLPC